MSYDLYTRRCGEMQTSHKLEVEMKCLVVSQFLNQYMTMARTDLVDEYKVSICKA